ncbi:hypothetical protein BDY21DRAFT_385781 [Lineolata rhizophorae]|uniref:DUF7924 domain-containing protein n=1 Tax=Lineolata rhizophorae TaxID=578093 RepID=A0A6A6P115_9PEZI|nr:hypothetical protein BDY21DRAFT_385781 [Lineolata rhizophorae]
MPESQPSNACKRRRAEERPPPSQSRPKRHKSRPYTGGYINTPAFWDSLSKIWLTKHALRELDRRNRLLRSPRHRPRSLPTARNALAAPSENAPLPPASAADFLRNCAPGHLQDVKRFARGGGPDLSDLVGVRAACFTYGACADDAASYPEPAPLDRNMSPSRSKDKKTSIHNDANYGQKLFDGGIIPFGVECPSGNRPPLPPNWDETRRKLAQPRCSLSPSTFPEEAKVPPAMLEAMGASRNTLENTLFNNIDPMTGDIARAKPDYFYGASHYQLHPDVRNELSEYIIPLNNTLLPAVPNFFLETKGPRGLAVVAQRQVCHDGAIGARAMQSLRSYGQSEPVYDNNAYTISSTYENGHLVMYSHSVAQPNGPGTRPEYYMHRLRSFSMVDSAATFLDGATVFKNAVDLTEKHRNDAIARANERAGQTIEDEGDDEDVNDDEVEGEKDIEDPDEDTEEDADSPPIVHILTTLRCHSKSTYT